MSNPNYLPNDAPIALRFGGGSPINGTDDSRKLHSRDDVDFDDRAHHHTIGDGPFQAARGSDFRALSNLITAYKTFAPTITSEFGAFAGGGNAPVAAMRWREIKGTIFFEGTVVIGAASVGTASGALHITTPFIILSNPACIGFGRETQGTGHIFSITRFAAQDIYFLRYDNAAMIANSRTFCFNGQCEKG